MACGRLVEQNPKCDEKESSEDAFALVGVCDVDHLALDPTENAFRRNILRI